MITDVEDYFARGCGRCGRFGTPLCVTRTWAEGLARLRALCRGERLEEVVRWGHPCYRHAGRNVALIGALKGDMRLAFFHPALMTDPAKVMERQGPNTRHPDVIRFRSAADVQAREAVVRAYLREAMGYAERGLVPPREPAAVEWPEELVEALDADPEMAEAFRGLTPGRQRSYMIALSSAKRPETRLARVAGFRGRILQGKGATER